MSEPITPTPADASGMRLVNGILVPAPVADQVFKTKVVGFTKEGPK